MIKAHGYYICMLYWGKIKIITENYKYLDTDIYITKTAAEGNAKPTYLLNWSIKIRKISKCILQII